MAQMILGCEQPETLNASRKTSTRAKNVGRRKFRMQYVVGHDIESFYSPDWGVGEASVELGHAMEVDDKLLFQEVEPIILSPAGNLRGFVTG